MSLINILAELCRLFLLIIIAVLDYDSEKDLGVHHLPGGLQILKPLRFSL